MEGFWSNAGEDVKGMGRDDIGKGRDYSNAVPSIGGLKEGVGIR